VRSRALLAAAVTIIIVAACSGAASSAPTSGAPTTAATQAVTPAPAYDITFVTPFTAYSPDWLKANVCFTKTAISLGAEPTVVGPNQFDPPAMVAFLEQAIAQKTEGIAIWAGDPPVFRAGLEEAKAAGIPVVLTQSEADDKSLRVAVVTTDLIAMGTDAGKKVIEKTGGTGNVGIITTGPGHADQVDQIDAFKAALVGSNVKVVDVQNDNSDAGKAAEVTAAMLRAHPEIDVIYTTEGAAPPAVGTVLKEMDLVGKVLVVAIDLFPQTRALIEEGVIWATYTQGHEKFGCQAAQILVDTLNGKPAPSPDVVDVGSNFITKDNLPPG
jgi:ribose transport system substrate-binding protein